MAVHVDKGSSAARVYTKGEAINVVDGHLFVKMWNSGTAEWATLATHAPGSWHRAEVTETEQS